jgi:hypothetical protein
MDASSYNALVGISQGGDSLFVKSGGVVELQSGAIVKNASGNAIDWDRFALSVDVADLSADADYYVPIPCACTLKKLWSAIDGAVSTADVTITPLKVGGSAMTDGAITIATADSAAGDIDSATPSANNTFAAGDVLKLTVAGGGSGGSPRGHVVLDFQRA